jgi:hypothetical protein
MKKSFSIKSRGLFDPTSDKPFKVSRSGIELYLECPRCFYLNHRHGIRRPSPFRLVYSRTANKIGNRRGD